MTQLDNEKIKKLRKGEVAGMVASGFCGVVLAYFVAMFAVSWATDNSFLQTIMWVTTIPLMVLGIAVAAFCNLKYGKALEREIRIYVIDVMVKNAALMRPNRSSLTFYIEILENSIEVSVNNFKEKIVFDFSAFKKLSMSRKMTITRIIGDKLTTTFVRLHERGAEYKSVTYRQTDKTSNKAGKLIPIIADGQPDKKAMKIYIKNK